MTAMPTTAFEKFYTLDLAALHGARFYHGTHSELFGAAGPGMVRPGKFDQLACREAQARIEAASVSGMPAVLTVAQAKAFSVALAMGVVALQNATATAGPRIPLATWDVTKKAAAEAAGKVLDPRSADATIVLSPFGATDTADKAIATTIRYGCSALHMLHKGAAPPDGKVPYLDIPPVVLTPPANQGIAPAAVAGITIGVIGVAAAVGWAIKGWKEADADAEKTRIQYDAKRALAIDYATKRVQAGLARLKLQADTGQSFDALPIESESTIPNIDPPNDGRTLGTVLVIGGALAAGGLGAYLARRHAPRANAGGRVAAR